MNSIIYCSELKYTTEEVTGNVAERGEKHKEEVNKYEYSIKRFNICPLIVSEIENRNGQAIFKDLTENFQY